MSVKVITNYAVNRDRDIVSRGTYRELRSMRHADIDGLQLLLMYMNELGKLYQMILELSDTQSVDTRPFLTPMYTSETSTHTRTHGQTD